MKTDENYFDEIIDKYPVLSVEEETELLRESGNGNQKAREKLVYSNIRFVKKVVGNYDGCGVPY